MTLVVKMGKKSKGLSRGIVFLSVQVYLEGLKVVHQSVCLNLNHNGLNTQITKDIVVRKSGLQIVEINMEEIYFYLVQIQKPDGMARLVA